MINKHDTLPKFCQLLNVHRNSGFSFLKISKSWLRSPNLEETLCCKSHDFISFHSNVLPFRFLHVWNPLSLHGAAGSQPWSKFKPCGSDHASSCQKDRSLHWLSAFSMWGAVLSVSQSPAHQPWMWELLSFPFCWWGPERWSNSRRLTTKTQTQLALSDLLGGDQPHRHAVLAPNLHTPRSKPEPWS